MTTAGRLLVATPRMEDENFDRTVILMLEHGDGGALGIVLNRCLDTPVAEMIAPWGPLAAAPGLFHQGGPVALDSVIGLAETEGPALATRGWSPVWGQLGTVDLHLEPAEVGVAIRQVRLFAGYAGWDAGQLEGELTLGAWFVVDADPTDPFLAEPDELWHRVLGRQPPPLGWLGNYPPDPSHN